MFLRKMKKSKKFRTSKFYFNKLSILFLGLGLGILSQHLPQVKKTAEKALVQLEFYIAQFNPKVLSSCSAVVQPDVLPSSLPIEVEKFYHPTSYFKIDRAGYSLVYDGRTRNPMWVYECLTAASVNGSAKRLDVFKEDEIVPSLLRATLTDYKGSGFDRGHQAPAADHRATTESMADTFYLTNMCPQCPEFNRGYWKEFETFVRELTQSYVEVHVLTGPLYLPKIALDGKRYVHYQVIGPHDVAVPTHFFKILILDDGRSYPQTLAYVLPNEKIESTVSLESFRTTIEKVEQVAGFVFSKF
jgi:endonuclease G, mitochondrial